MNQRFLVLLAALLAKFWLLVLPLWDIATTVFGAARESVAPLAAWAGLLAAVLAVYLACSAVVDALWAIAAALGKELVEEFRLNWKRVLVAVLVLTAVFHPLRSWHYLLGFAGFNDLTETAVLISAQVSSNHHLLVMAAGFVVMFALPPLRAWIQVLRPWHVVLACAVLLSFAASLLPPVSRAWREWMASSLQAGNDRVFVGTDQWLFDRREIRALTGDAKDADVASQCVLDFASQLKERGVPLLIIPVPMKTSMYPELITGDAPEDSVAPLYHLRQPEIYAAWSKAGVDVQNVADSMKEKRTQMFARQSSYWTPDAIQLLAKGIAMHVREKYPGAAAPAPQAIGANARDAVDAGDLSRALGVDWPAERFVLINLPAIHPDPNSPVVLLGGSDVRVYEDPALGYVPAGSGIKASFARHLAFYLGRSIDEKTVNDGAATACRQWLAGESDEQLRGKKLVIWLLPVADLLLPKRNDWQSVSFSSTNHKP